MLFLSYILRSISKAVSLMSTSWKLSSTMHSDKDILSIVPIEMNEGVSLP